MTKKSVKLYTDNVLDEFYRHVLDNDLENLHIPHSDVFYVRNALEMRYNRKFTLQEVESAMIAEGWKDA
jgi:hypothetical protein